MTSHWFHLHCKHRKSYICKIAPVSVLLFIFLASTGFFQQVQAQNWKKILENISTPDKVAKQRGPIESALCETPDDVMANYCLAIVNKQAGDIKSLFDAWMQIEKAVTVYKSDVTVPPKKDIIKLMDDAPSKFAAERRSIDSLLWLKSSQTTDLKLLRSRMLYLENSGYRDKYMALLNKLEHKEAVVLNSLAAYERFLALFPDAQETEDVIARRDALEFEKAKKTDSIGVYNDFITWFPKSKLLNEVIKIRDQKAFDQLANTTNIATIDNFIAKYPSASQVTKALQAREKLVFDLAVQKKTIQGIQEFIRQNPLSALIPDAVNHRDALVFAEMQQLADSAAFSTFMSEFPFAIKAFEKFLEQYRPASGNTRKP